MRTFLEKREDPPRRHEEEHLRVKNKDQDGGLKTEDRRQKMGDGRQRTGDGRGPDQAEHRCRPSELKALFSEISRNESAPLPRKTTGTFRRKSTGTFRQKDTGTMSRKSTGTIGWKPRPGGQAL
jgi:hypothetical protein